MGFLERARIHRPLGGSWVVISGVINRVTMVTSHIRGLITPLIATLNPITPYIEYYRTLKGTL